MQRLIFGALLTTLVFGFSGDLIKNGSFEAGTNTQNIPLFWGDSPYNQSLVRGYQNSKSLLITNPKPGYSIGAQIIPLTLTANTIVSLIGQIKGTDIIPEKEAWQGAKAQVVFLDKDGQELSQTQETPVYTGTFDWQLFVQNIIVPVGATQVKILVGLWGAQGAVYFDDIMLYPMAQKPIKQPPNQSILVNGDFELWGNWQFLGEGLKEVKFPGNNNEGQALYITNSRHVWTFARQDIQANKFAGKKLILTGEYKCTKVVPGKEKWQKGRIYVEYLDKDDKLIGSWVELLAVSGTKDWTDFSKDLTVPKNTETLRIYCGLQEASGEIAFDNLYIKLAR
jgi:hypothetical protein